MGALAGIMEAQYEVLRKHGHSPSEAFNETVEELTQNHALLAITPSRLPPSIRIGTAAGEPSWRLAGFAGRRKSWIA